MKNDLAFSVKEALRDMSAALDVVKDTHGNVSAFGDGYMYIKPSGMKYHMIVASDVSRVKEDGEHVYGGKPSVDTPHHLSIYKRHPWVKAICHTHSPYATAFAIAGWHIECLSTEQADYFGGNVRCLPYADLDKWGDEVSLVEGEKAVLLGKHGALTFSDDPQKAVALAVALENVAQKNHLAINLPVGDYLHPLKKEVIERWHWRYNNVYGQR